MGKIFKFRRKRQKRTKRRSQLLNVPWQSLAVLLAAAAILWAYSEFSPFQFGDESGHASFALCMRKDQQNCVIDGDTIGYGGDTIRLQDIDAPEIGGAQCASEEALGRRAKQRLLELMNDGPFHLVNGGRRDRFGRRLSTIMREGRSLGDMLISEGLARRWDGARRSWC